MKAQLLTVVVLLLLCCWAYPQPEKRDVLDVYSFDYLNHKIPLAYKTYDQSIELLSKIKLMSAVKNKQGAVFLKKQLDSLMFEIDIEFTIQSDLENSNGFAIMLLKREFERPQDYGSSSGSREDFNGVGVFLYKSVKKTPGRWHVIFLQNKGLIRYSNFEDLILPSNSCPVEIASQESLGIRILRNQEATEIWAKPARINTPHYLFCNKQSNIEVFKPYFGLLANNNQATNDIDITAIKVKNMDQRVYQDKKVLEEERLQYLIDKNSFGQHKDSEDRNHAHDLLAVKLQEEIQIEQKKNLVYLNQKDDEFEIMFKYYEALHSYEQNLDEFKAIMTETKQNIDNQIAKVVKKKKVDKLDDYLSKFEGKCEKIKNEYQKVQTNVLGGIFNSKIAEEIESLKNQDIQGKIQAKSQEAATGDQVTISNALIQSVQQLIGKSNKIISSVNKELTELQQFTNDFPDNCVSQLLKIDEQRERSKVNKKIPEDILYILRNGAVEMKAQVDRDHDSGFPILSLIVLVGIVLILYLIWDRISHKINPHKNHAY